MVGDREAVRYEHAALMALDQLDWCVEYLRRIRKTQIADRVARNREAIIGRLAENGDRERHDE
jgi:hypothetical protein